MLYDRTYMQSDQNPRTRNMVLGIIVFNVVMYAIQLTAGEGYFRLFALTTNDYDGPKLCSASSNPIHFSLEKIWWA